MALEIYSIICHSVFSVHKRANQNIPISYLFIPRFAEAAGLRGHNSSCTRSVVVFRYHRGSRTVEVLDRWAKRFHHILIIFQLNKFEPPSVEFATATYPFSPTIRVEWHCEGLSWWFGICICIFRCSSSIRLKDIVNKIRESYSDRHRLKSVGISKAICRRKSWSAFSKWKTGKAGWAD